MSTHIFDGIKGDLKVLEEALYETIVAPDPLVTEVGRHLVHSGGKRIRPALAILSAKAANKDIDLSDVLPLAQALELIHMASLVHDDVIDESDTRRGSATANAKWGNQVAILAGDFIFARAFELVASENYGDKVYGRLATLVCNLSVGEIIQDRAAFHQSRNIDDYYSRIQKKTADFLEICCDLGAGIGGMDEINAKKMADYGHSIGMAFQITDDLLDIEQTSEKIGKPVGSDIRQGIATLPVIRALEVSPDSSELERILQKKDMTDDEVSRALALVRATDGVDYAKKAADDFLAHAKDVLPETLSPDLREVFCTIADFIGKREF